MMKVEARPVRLSSLELSVSRLRVQHISNATWAGHSFFSSRIQRFELHPYYSLLGYRTAVMNKVQRFNARRTIQETRNPKLFSFTLYFLYFLIIICHLSTMLAIL